MSTTPGSSTMALEKPWRGSCDNALAAPRKPTDTNASSWTSTREPWSPSDPNLIRDEEAIGSNSDAAYGCLAGPTTRMYGKYAEKCQLRSVSTQVKAVRRSPL